jgi:O-antigen ligase
MTAADLRMAVATPMGRLKVALVAVAIALPCLIGVAVARVPLLPVVAAVALVAAALALAMRPQAAGLALLFFTSTIFTQEYIPKVELSNNWGFFVTELLIAAYIVYRGLRLLVSRDRAYQITAAEIMLAVFLVDVLVSTYAATAAGRIDLGTARSYGRRYLIFASFFLFTGTMRDERSYRRALDVVQIFAAVTAVLTIAQVLVGRETRLFFGNPLEYIQGVPGEYPRVRPPGFYLTYALFLPSLSLLLAARGGRRWLQIAYVALYSAAIVISLQRSVWLALMAGVAAYVVMSSGWMRVRALRALVIALVLLVAVTIGLAKFVPGFGATAYERIVTSGTPTDINTLERLVEYRLAFRQIAREPWFGSGPGIDYGNVTFNVVGDHYEAGVQPFTHDSFVNLLLYFGVFGLVSFLAFVLLALRPAWQTLRQDADGGRRNLAAATVAGVAVVFVSAFGLSVLDVIATMPVLTLLLTGLSALAHAGSAGRREDRRPARGPVSAAIVGMP